MAGILNGSDAGSNDSVNFSTPLPGPEDRPPMGPAGFIIPIVFSLIFLVGVTDNGIVITIMACRKKHRRSTTNVFILNLAIADLMFIICCVPFQGTIYTLPGWIFGAFMCKLVNYLIYANMLASIFTLAVMSFDRYLAVAHPIITAHLRTWRCATVACFAIWVVALATATPFAVYFNTFRMYDYGWHYICYDSWPTKHARSMYIASLFLIGFVIPFLLITFCYINILRNLWCLPKELKNIKRWDGMKRSISSKKKAAKMVIVVVMVFGICWLPHHVTTMWLSFGKFPFNELTFVLKITAHCLSYANSCMNPIIYVFMSDNFKKDFSHILGSVSRRRSLSSNRKSTFRTSLEVNSNHSYGPTWFKVVYTRRGSPGSVASDGTPNNVRIMLSNGHFSHNLDDHRL